MKLDSLNACLALLLLSSPLGALEQTPSPSPAPSTAAPRPESGQRRVSPPDDRRRVRGTLRALDGEEKTVTFVDGTGKVLTWAVDARIAAAAVAMAQRRMQTLKAGDDVMIVYHLDASGTPRVIDISRYREETRPRNDG